MAKKDWLQTGADGLTFGERLDDLRYGRGITQSQLAAETGIAQSRISGYINEKKNGAAPQGPDCATIIAFAKYFGVSTDYLLGLSAVKTPSITTQAIIDQTGLTEEAVMVLLGMKAMNLNERFGSFASDMILGTMYSSNAMANYVSMMAALELPNPTYPDQMSTEDILYDIYKFYDELSRRGVAALPAEDSFRYYAEKTGAVLTDWLIRTYESQGAWNKKEETQDGID